MTELTDQARMFAKTARIEHESRNYGLAEFWIRRLQQTYPSAEQRSDSSVWIDGVQVV